MLSTVLALLLPATSPDSPGPLGPGASPLMVHGMLLWSAPHPDVMAIAELPADARLIGHFEGEAVPRDLTGWLADLLVMGYHSLQRKAEGMPDPSPEEQVQVGELTLTVPFEAGNFVILAPTAQVTYVLTPEQTLELLYRGVGDTITAGVAHDVITEALTS